MALSLPTGYLMLKERLKPVKALIIILIPLAWSSWLEFNYNEMPIVLFFSFLSIFLLLRWFNTGNRYLLYTGSFISGFGFYIKANQLYTLNGVIAGFLTKIDRLKALLGSRKLLYAFALFLIGSLPFLIYTVNVDFRYLNIEQLQPDYDDPPDRSTTEVRLDQLRKFTKTGPGRT